MPLYRLVYRHNNSISVVIEPGASLIHARMRAALANSARSARLPGSCHGRLQMRRSQPSLYSGRSATTGTAENDVEFFWGPCGWGLGPRHRDKGREAMLRLIAVAFALTLASSAQALPPVVSLDQPNPTGHPRPRSMRRRYAHGEW